MKLEDQYHRVHKPPYNTRRRILTATALLTAIAYTIGVTTSPLFSLRNDKPLLKISIQNSEQRPEDKNSEQRAEDQNWKQRAEDQNSEQRAEDQNWKQRAGDLTRFEARCSEPVASNRVRQILIDGFFNATSPYEGFPPHHARALIRPKRIKGWGSTGPVFERLIKEIKPKIILELGTFLGASALHMAAIARDQGLETQILCVDDFRGWPGFRDKFRDVRLVNGDVMLLYQFLQNVVFMNMTEFVLPLPFATVAMVRKLCEMGVYADLIEVDAAHDFLSAWADINTAWAVLRGGGVMFGHDYRTRMDNSGVRRAVHLFARMRDLRVEPDGQHWILRSK